MTQEQIYTNYDENDFIVTDDMILDNEIIGVNFVRKYENKEDGFKAYEFSTKEDLYFELDKQRGSYFRLEITKDNVYVQFALRDEFMVFEEDLTYAFNIEDLFKRVLLQDNIDDVQEEYDMWLEDDEDDE
ncbi:hypothetical protein [Bacillus toyonensis]|uniref:hypothetical protein n=1 Tax=Bacillus toyonensis TaxID=155322 RepID=UPI002E224D42|nr:hypothetical protein [Bacillus toyonensis]